MNGEKVEDENVNQTEVSYVEESETDRIKRLYEFVLPVSRSCFIRVWDKRS